MLTLPTITVISLMTFLMADLTVSTVGFKDLNSRFASGALDRVQFLDCSVTPIPSRKEKVPAEIWAT